MPPVKKVGLVSSYSTISSADEIRLLYRLSALQQEAETDLKVMQIEWIQAELHSRFGRDASTTDSILQFWSRQLKDESLASPEWVIAFIQERLRISESEPVKVYEGDWIYKGFLYAVKGIYSDDQIKLLILEEFDKERRRFERLRQKHSSSGDDISSRQRPRIPENIRIEVWRRDGGKCARCGSRENLEYDHIIPVSKGGSDTSRNIELLCEKCNRSKGANIV